tara:strand:- start:51 stop:4388 length:4338 start_codon:yes stop_codon:yes gene_type:complete
MDEDNTEMDEDNTEIGGEATEAPSPFKLVEHDKEDVALAFQNHGADTEEFLAVFTSRILNNHPSFQGKARYDELRSGKAEILQDPNLVGKFQYGTPLTNDQILRIFSSLRGLGEDGVPTSLDAFLSGLTRSGSSTAVGIKTAKMAASAAPAYVPLPGPLAPFGVLSKPIAGVGGFIAGSILTDKFVAKPLANELFGTIEGLDIPLTPKAERMFRQAESAGQVLPFVFLQPWMAPLSKISTISNLKKLPLANRARSTLTEEELANPLIQKYLEGTLKGFPKQKDISNLTNKIFAEAKEAGKNITLKEAKKQAFKQLKSTDFFTKGVINSVDFLENALVAGGKLYQSLGGKGKIGVGLAESTAVPLTYLSVGASEESFPRSTGARVVAETGSAIVPNIMLLKYAPILLEKLSKNITAFKERSALKQQGVKVDPLLGDLLGIKKRAKIRAIDDIYEVLNDNAEDPQALLKQLEELIVDPVYSQGKIVSYNLKPEFEQLASQGENLPKAAIFTSQFIDNQAIAQLEGTVMKRSGKAGAFSTQRESSFVKSMEMQRGIIRAMVGTGDPELVKLAGKMMQERIGILIQSRLENAVNATVESVKKLYPEGGANASSILGERLHKVMKNQEELFNRLQKNAWQKVSKKVEINTFYRTDPKSGEKVENNIPNIVEQWEAILRNSSDLERKRILRVPEFADINEFVKRIKSDLRLERAGFLSDVPNTAQYRNRLDSLLIEMEGDPTLIDNFETVVDFSRKMFVGKDGTPIMGIPDNATLTQLQTNSVQGVRVRNPEEIREVLAPENLQINALRRRIQTLEDANVGDNRNPRRTLLINALKAQRNLLAAQSGQRAKIIDEGDVLEGSKGIKAQEIFGLYSTTGELAREFGTVKSNFARISNIMREAALEDLNGLPVGQLGNYDAARNISYAYQNFLKRTFAGDILQTNATGKQIVAPYLLTSRLITGRADAVDLRLLEIQEVGQQIRKYAKENNYNIVAREEVDDTIGTANEVLSDMLRLSIREIELPMAARKGLTTEQIALKQDELLQQFVVKNERLLDKFPKLRQMIDDADNAGTFLRRALETTGRLSDKVKNQKAYSKLIASENPEVAVATAFNSENPSEEFKSLITVLNTNVFKKSSPNRAQRIKKVLDEFDFTQNYRLEDARKGLRTSIMNFAFTKGGSLSSDNFRAEAVFNTLFERIPKAKDENFSLVKFMVDNDVITTKEANALRQGLVRIINTEAKKNVQDAIVTNQTSFLSDLYTRILGAKFGTTIGGSLPGARGPGVGFIEAEAGSRFLKQLTQELPALQEMDALEKILFDPTLLALALREPRSEAEKVGIFNAILSGLKTVVGAIPAPAIVKGTPLTVQEVVEEEIPSEAPVIEQEQRPDVRSQVTPNLSPPINRSQQPAMFSQVTPSLNPVQNTASANAPLRKRFAALFPEDRALIEGIGSLRG